MARAALQPFVAIHTFIALLLALYACGEAPGPGGDALASAVALDDACAAGAGREACEVSLRQLRGEAQAASVGKHEASEGPPDFLLPERAAGRARRPQAGDHSRQSATEDYRRDAEAFLQTYSGGNLPSCNLAKVSLAEADSAFSRMLNESWTRPAATESATVDDNFRLMAERDGPAQYEEAADAFPWAPDRPLALGNPLARARKRFGNELFGGLPGLVAGVASGWPAMARWRSTEDLISRVGDRRIPIHFWTFLTGRPVEATSLPRGLRARLRAPSAESLAEYLARNDSGRNFFVFVNEPEHPWSELSGLVQDLSKDIQPMPSFSARAEERHGILAIDGAGSSHGFHRHDGVWQTQVTGRKMWWLLPPSVPAVGNWHSPPQVDGQVYGNPNACELLLRRAPPEGAHVCVMEPGDTVVLPDRWWHATCALDLLTASIGGWLQDQQRDTRAGSEEPEPTARALEVEAGREEGEAAARGGDGDADNRGSRAGRGGES